MFNFSLKQTDLFTKYIKGTEFTGQTQILAHLDGLSQEREK